MARNSFASAFIADDLRSRYLAEMERCRPS